MSSYIPPVSEEEKLVQRRVADAVKAVRGSGAPKYLGFFNDREMQLAVAELNRQKWSSYKFSGGFEGAERSMLCVFEDLDEIEFPLTTVFIRVNNAPALTHRDYLGALLGTGVKRDRVGDITVLPQGASAVVATGIVQLLKDEFVQVGRFSVCVETEAPLPFFQPNQEAPSQTASVSSLRLDAVLAAMLRQSRGVAALLVSKGGVQVNHVPIQTLHHPVNEGDVFSVKGVGKYRLTVIGGKSRKNKTFIQFIQY